MIRSNIPVKPEGFDPDTFFQGVHWHQKWEMYEGVFTPGRNPVKELLEYAGVPEDLKGKSVLDIGAWNGGFSFECARRGATHVVGLGPDDPDAAGFNSIKDILGYDNVDYVRGSAYDLDATLIGTFDIVLFLGVIYHLRYPLLALDKIFEVCREKLFVESYIIDDYFMTNPASQPLRLDEVDPRLAGTPLWQFFQFDELNADGSNWFGPNLRALCAAVESAGFEVLDSRRWGDRAALSAKKSSRQFAEMNSYEKDPTIAASINLHLGTE